MRLILDTNVLLDILQNREPWAKDGIIIFRAIAEGKITGCITAKQIADIHFFARKMYKGEDNIDAKARLVVGKLLNLFEVVGTLAVDCQDALGIDNGDYEDAILIATAIRERVDGIITRNVDHFQVTSISVYTPADFIALVLKRIVSAWDSDFTKVTPAEAAVLEKADAEIECGETVADGAID